MDCVFSVVEIDSQARTFAQIDVIFVGERWDLTQTVDTATVYALHGFLLPNFCNGDCPRFNIQQRCRVPLELTKGNESLQVMMFSPNVENLTGITAQQLRDSDEFDLDVYQDLQMSLEKLRVVCFVKKYDQTTLGRSSNPRLRYSVVKAYTLDAIQQHTALPPSLETRQPLLPSQEQTSPNAEDVQFFTPNTKRILTEVEDISAPEKPTQPGPSAKRSIDFMSAESTPTKLGDPTFSTTESA